MVTYQYPRAGAEVPYGTTVYLYTDTYEGRHTEVPDVTGKSADFARQMLAAAGSTALWSATRMAWSRSRARRRGPASSAVPSLPLPVDKGTRKTRGE